MSKKKLAIILGCGAAISGAIAYYLLTMRKVKEIEDDSLEDEDFDDFEDMIDEDIEADLDEDETEDSESVCVEFDEGVHSNKLFETVNRACEAGEPQEIDEETPELDLDTDENFDEEESEPNDLDYGSEFFELVFKVSRDKAIEVILKNTDKYTEDVLTALTNSELAEIYSKVIDN